MTKVYVVMSGEYSDRCVEGVFSTEEKAQFYCDVHEKTEPYNCPYYVMDYELDKHELEPTAEVKTYYVVSIEIKDGTFSLDEIDGITEDRIFDKPVVIEEDDESIQVSSIYGFEHAKKVAIEQYQIYTQQQLEDEICKADKSTKVAQVSKTKKLKEKYVNDEEEF